MNGYNTHFFISDLMNLNVPMSELVNKLKIIY